MSMLTALATMAALLPLFSVLYMLIEKGAAALSLDRAGPATARGDEHRRRLRQRHRRNLGDCRDRHHNQRAGRNLRRGLYRRVRPRDPQIAEAVRFAAKVLTGLPSILAGVFAFAVVVVATGGFSAPAAGVALALLMVPTILLTPRRRSNGCPSKMREAAVGMGATPTQVVAKWCFRRPCRAS